MSNPFGCCSCSGMLCPFFFLLSICFIHQEDPCKEEFGATQHPDNNLQLLNGLLAFLFFGIWSALIYKNHYFDLRDFQYDFYYPTHTDSHIVRQIMWGNSLITTKNLGGRCLSQGHSDMRTGGAREWTTNTNVYVHSLYCKKKKKKKWPPTQCN